MRWVPLARHHAATATPKTVRPHPTILVVDDDEYVHGTLAAALRQLKPTLVQAWTAAEGLALAIEHQPAIAIVDLGLPDASGYEFTEWLRATPGLEQLRIVILTGDEPDPWRPSGPAATRSSASRSASTSSWRSEPAARDDRGLTSTARHPAHPLRVTTLHRPARRSC